MFASANKDVYLNLLWSAPDPSSSFYKCYSTLLFFHLKYIFNFVPGEGILLVRHTRGGTIGRKRSGKCHRRWDGEGPRAAAVPGAVAGSAPPEARCGRKGLRSGRSGAPSLHVR